MYKKPFTKLNLAIIRCREGKNRLHSPLKYLWVIQKLWHKFLPLGTDSRDLLHLSLLAPFIPGYN